ncbi:MAG: amidohydrolase [Clostridiales bacterium]|nr:amidohydrolase [Clostridiales bacterium]
MPIDAVALAKENEVLAVRMRRRIHRRPELSAMEFETLEYIKANLDEFKIQYVEVDNGGILGFLGDPAKGRTLGLRADIDALAIHESRMNMKREKTCVSEIDGVCHACGHDAHAAILLAAGKILKQNEEFLNGRIILFFERGEETSNNITELVKWLRKEGTDVDAFHALHMDSRTPSGKFRVEAGPRHAGSLTLNVRIKGKGGHGSRPDLANSPIDAFAAVYSASYAIRLKSISPFDMLTFSIGRLESGLGPNTIPSSLSFSGTVRYYREEAGKTFAKEFLALLDGACKGFGVQWEADELKFGLPTVNNEKMADLIRETIIRIYGSSALEEKLGPSMGSETFSLLATLYPSCIISLGCANEELGTTSGHHTDRFDIDESALHVGVAESVAFAEDFLNYRGELPFEPYKGSVEELLG